ncbi:hypothetical protein BJX76DRAFT_335189 [Aspergillus varians]
MFLSYFYILNIHPINKSPPFTVPVRSKDDIIAAHHPLAHLSCFPVEGPVFKAVAPLPLHGVVDILILVPELDRDTVIGEGEKLFS